MLLLLSYTAATYYIRVNNWSITGSFLLSSWKYHCGKASFMAARLISSLDG